MYDTVEGALHEWADGEIIARKSDQHGGALVVTRDTAGGYSILRVFTMDGKVGVSVDARELSADDVINHVMRAIQY